MGEATAAAERLPHRRLAQASPVEAFFLPVNPPFRQRPSVRDLPADLLTPVGAYLRLRDLGPGFLLESIERGQQVGRWSFLGAGCEVVTLDHAAADPFAPLRAFLGRHADADLAGLPPFAGGVVGHLAYDVVARFEPTVPLPAAREDDVSGPSRFLLVPVVVAFDHVRQRVQVVAQPGHEALADEMAARLTGPVDAAALPVAALSAPGAVHAEIDRDQYLAMVATAKEHIAAGDAFQIVPSQRHLRQTARSAAAIYRALRTVNPSPYMFFLETDGLAVVGASPETHVSLNADGIAALRPIAGTRPRGATAAEDDALAAELERDEKERAEHMMLVDLARNDLARVCEPGSVRPTRLLEVERYSHVMHLVSDVQGRLRETEDAFSLLRDTFPAGTVSGAPKVRAMQIISALEPHRRGIYAGAIGYVGFGGTLDTCIALRTIVLRDGIARLQAGGGVVADSDPAAEHQECISKMAALQRAIDLAETGAYGR
jgi:anthranilate synthase component I